MKLQKATLKKAIKLAKLATKGYDTHVCQFNHGWLIVRGGNGTARYRIGDAKGVIQCDFNSLSKMADALPDQVEIAKDNGFLTFTAPKFVARILSFDPDKLDGLDFEKTHGYVWNDDTEGIGRAQLRHARQFVSSDFHRQVLTGVYVKGSSMVATDTHRLSCQNVPPFSNDPDHSMVIPCSVIDAILSQSGPFQLNWDANRIKASGLDWSYSAALLNAKYIDVNPVLAVEPGDAFSFDTNQLKAAVKMLSVVAKNAAGRLIFNIAGSVCEIRASCDDIGQASASVNFVSSYAGSNEVREFAINCGYLADILKFCGPVVTITSSAAGNRTFHNGKPFTIASDGHDWRHIIMPMAIV